MYSSPLSPKISNVFIHVSELKRSSKWYYRLIHVPFHIEKVKSPAPNLLLYYYQSNKNP